jgi:hypothetical protein
VVLRPRLAAGLPFSWIGAILAHRTTHRYTRIPANLFTGVRGRQILGTSHVRSSREAAGMECPPRLLRPFSSFSRLRLLLSG